MSKWKKAEPFLGMVVVIGALLACGKSHSSSSTSAPEKAKPGATKPAADPKPAAEKVKPIGASAPELMKAYKENEVAADQKYKGKRIITGGIVGEIKKDVMDNIYVTIGTGKQFEIPVVQAFFDDEWASKAASLKRGDKLFAECDCEGLMMNVIMRNCEIKTPKE